MSALLRYDAACQAIAEAKTVDEVTEWIDKAAAVREYTRRIRNRQIEIDAIEIRVRARRRRGELLLQMKEAGLIRDGKRSVSDDRLTLDDLGISKDDSSDEQKIARIDGNSFERLVARCRAYAEAHPEKHAFDVLKPPPEEGAVTGARSIMASRQEPDDSLDFFPTPPFATRALCELVLPRVVVARPRIWSAWEPACGEGHIAEVLREYFDVVHASDVHDYGYAAANGDFLTASATSAPIVDWIVTNPPFDEKALAFVERALDLAPNVAMFFRTQWAVEGIERYERMFRDRPPTLHAYFVERVNLCKGRWDPDGTTATAYCWLVWMKGEAARAPFYIPPGCRKSLERADDRERFAAHPVVALPADVAELRRSLVNAARDALPPHDPETGEIGESLSSSSPACGGGPLAASERGGGEPPASATLTPDPSPQEGEESGQRASLRSEDILELPSFLKRNADNVAPWMERA